MLLSPAFSVPSFVAVALAVVGVDAVAVLAVLAVLAATISTTRVFAENFGWIRFLVVCFPH